MFDPFTSYEVTVSIYKRNCTLCAFELKPESTGINQLINNRCLKFVCLFIFAGYFVFLSVVFRRYSRSLPSSVHAVNHSRKTESDTVTK